MRLSINPYKLFILSAFISTFLVYFFKSGAVAYSFFILFGFFVFFKDLSYLFYKKSKELIFLLFVPYVIYALFVYIDNPYNGKYFSSYLLNIIFLPIMVSCCFRFFCCENKKNNFLFLYKLFFYFLLFELLICIGQISYYLFGVGLPVNETYAAEGMVTGTFYNSNDLGAVVLIISFIVLGIEKYLLKRNLYVFWILVIFLLIISGSRSAFFITFCFLCFYKIRRIDLSIKYFFSGFFIFFIMFFLIKSIDSEVTSRFLDRGYSLVNLFSHGLSSDNSISIRLQSYNFYLNKIPELGFGSGLIHDYSKYSEGANFNASDLLFQNPHSLIVEIGYWLGLPGLFLFFTPFFFMISNSKRKVQVLIVFLFSSMISSSVLSDIIFYFLILISFFDYSSD